MKPPPDTKLNLSRSDKTIVMGVSIIIVIAVAAIVVLIGILLRQIGEQRAEVISTSVPTSANPSLVVPTVDCGSPSLVIGSTTFQIQTFTPGPDGLLSVPPDTPGIAYWVEGTDNNYVFLLSPTPENLALQTSLKSGDGLTVFRQDCRFKEFTISTLQAGQAVDRSLLDQSAPGINILIQTGPSALGFVIQGVEGQATITSNQNQISADLSLVDIVISPDGTTIRVGVSIVNFGTAPFTISASDVSLVPENAEPLGTMRAEPPLPQEINPGATAAIYFTFPHPASPTATLKIFSVEFDIEGY